MLCLALQVHAQDSLSKPKERFTFYRIGIDVSKPLSYLLTGNNLGMELHADVDYKKDLNLLCETGFAKNKTQSNAVNFQCNSIFLRLGADKTFFSPDFLGDKDNAFVGIRAAMAQTNYSQTEAQVLDPIYGNTILILQPKNKYPMWLELTGGFRIEWKKNLFAGWNIRAATFINPNALKELAPNYLAGYGNAEKQPNFNYNFYLLFGFGKR